MLKMTLIIFFLNRIFPTPNFPKFEAAMHFNPKLTLYKKGEICHLFLCHRPLLIFLLCSPTLKLQVSQD